jgi:hypothetical protein
MRRAWTILVYLVCDPVYRRRAIEMLRREWRRR